MNSYSAVFLYFDFIYCCCIVSSNAQFNFVLYFLVDLVTLDDLSAEAMLESSQRIEQLAEIFRQKQEPMSDPGPPSTLPMSVKSSNCIVQGIVLFT